MSNPASSKSSVNSRAPEDQHHDVDKRPREDTNVDAQAAQQEQNGEPNGDANETNGSSTEPEGGYPPQKHAGAVGLGPEYGAQQKAVSNQCHRASESWWLTVSARRPLETRYKG